LADAARDFLCSVSDEQPVLIVIDDINQSDEASVAVLHYLLRRLRGARLMVLMTWRTGVSEDRRVLAQLRETNEQPGLQVLDLAPMSFEDSESLFDILCNELGTTPTAIEKRELLSAAAGLPLAIALLLQDWSVNGQRSAALAISGITSDVHADPDLRYQQFAESMFGGLTNDDRIVAHLAAILDRRVGELEIYEVASIPKAVTLRALTHLLDHRALRDTPTGIEWINPSVRAYAYVTIPPSVRRLLHNVVFEELRRRAGVGQLVPGLEIAWHSFRAGRADEGVADLNNGAGEALRAGAPREAEKALLTAMPELTGDTRDTSALLLAEALQEQGKFEESLKWLSTLSNSPRALQSRALVLTSRVLVNECGRTSTLPSILENLVLVARSAEEVSTRVLAISVAAAAAKWGLTARLQEGLLQACKEIPQETLGPEDLLPLWTAHAKILFVSRRLREADELLERGLALATERRIRNIAFINTLNGLGAIAVVRGEYDRALGLSLRLHNECIRQGSDYRIADAAANVAICYFRLGQYSESMRWIRSADPMRVDAPLGQRIISLLMLADIAYFAGERGLAREVALQLEEAYDAGELEGIRRLAALGAANTWFMLGERERAKSFARRGLDLNSMDVGDFDNYWRIAQCVCLLAPESGDQAKASALLRHLLELPLDRIDRAAVLAGVVRLGEDAFGEANELRDLLRSLPAPVTEQFEQYGLLRRASEWVSTRLKEYGSSGRSTGPMAQRPQKMKGSGPAPAEEEAVVGSQRRRLNNLEPDIDGADTQIWLSNHATNSN
jgi:tetratricopeptide (TPR) repeat protein